MDELALGIYCCPVTGLLALRICLVEEVERDHVHGTYEAPLPTFGEPPAKTIYFFVPQDVHREPFWSYNPFPWPDVAAVENARSERQVLAL